MRSEILLRNLLSDLSQIQKTVDLNFKDLSHEQLNWKENQNNWSIAECLEHLNIYAAYYLPTIERLIAKAKKDIAYSKLEAKSNWFGKYSINSIAPSNAKKIKTMKHLDPSRSKIEGDVLERFLVFQNQFKALLKRAHEVNLNKVKVPVEFFKLLKINLGDCFQFLLAHEQRHINQALNVKKTMEQTAKVA